MFDFKNKQTYRPIVAVDGEGFTYWDKTHEYAMISVSGQDPLLHMQRDGTGKIVGLRELRTIEILDYLHAVLNPEHLNVIFGGGYDFNMWLKGMDRKQLEKARKGKSVTIGDYSVRMLERKYFSFRKSGDARSIIVYDVLAFFQCTFIKACDEFIPGYKGREILVKQKAARGKFSPEDTEEILEYNNLEVDLLVQLVETLREYLVDADLVPKQWYGPGDIVAQVYKRMGISEAKAVTPAGVQLAARFAYFGGRFEMFKYGDVSNDVWEYDINSAYPAAIRTLPNLRRGYWVHRSSRIWPHTDPYFSVYRVRYEAVGDSRNLPNPLPYRDRHGKISYPNVVEGWYWKPEVDAIQETYGNVREYKLEILESWSLYDDGSKPFDFINHFYQLRREAKIAHLGVQIAYKLFLNSAYGKLAQQVGAREIDGVLTPPKWHQLEWAGYITSVCRATLLRAISLDPTAIVAVETDALFSIRELQVPISDLLGDFKPKHFTGLTYLQSGMYYADEESGEVEKTRGLEAGSLTREGVRSKLALSDESKRHVFATVYRFHSSGIALQTRFDRWCKWVRERREIKLYPTGKRLHVAELCEACKLGLSLSEAWHQTSVLESGGNTRPYKVSWPIIEEETDLERVTP